mmetsp:Transcript_26504/g.23480  ORF Transcript_26504/g.23480 Transcript_26504/m.23480 type:complete len:82 (+) Transcript_26504:219-464(+)
MIIEIITAINSMLESNSLFLIKKSTELLHKLTGSSVPQKVSYDSQTLLNNLVHIILNLDRKDIKYSNYYSLSILSRSNNFF